MYIDIYSGMQDGPSLVIMATILHFAHCGPFMKNWLFIFVLVEHMSAQCPDPERLVPMEST